MNVLNEIQIRLNAPKDKYNSFGKYSYRSCESILEAVKPLLSELKCTLVLNDEIVQVGERYYIKATAMLTDEQGKQFSASAYAREDEDKKGLDGAQLSGSTSSYARKYALNGLFAIDDNKDPDANEHAKIAGGVNKPSQSFANIEAQANACKSKEELGALYQQCVKNGSWNDNTKALFTKVKTEKGWN